MLRVGTEYLEIVTSTDHDIVMTTVRVKQGVRAESEDMVYGSP